MIKCLPIRFLLSLCAVLMAYCSYAQKAGTSKSISGTVIDSTTGQPISYATVSLVNGKEKAVVRVATSTKGTFHINNNDLIHFKIIISCIGYAPFSADFRADSVKIEYPLDLGIIKLRAGINISEVTVKLDKPIIREEDSKLIYDLDADPETSSSQLVDILKKIPMLDVDGDDNVSLNGEKNYKVLVNGKESPMYSRNFKDVIRSLPASAVKEVEIITNPSTKYDAEGLGGIINIITKRRVADGYLGNVNMRWMPDLNAYHGMGYLAVNKGKFNLSVTSGYVHSPMLPVYTLVDSKISEPSVQRSVSTSNGNTGKAYFIPLNVMLSYDIDSLNLLSLEFNYNTANAKYNSEKHYTEYDDNNAVIKEYINNGKEGINRWFGMNTTVDYQRLFKKPQEILTVSYQFNRSLEMDDYLHNYTGIVNQRDYIRKVENDGVQIEHTGQIDYVNPINKKNEIELGLKYIYRDKNNDADVYEFDDGLQSWILDLDRTSFISYYQHVYSAYGNYAYKARKVTVRMGVRAEGTVNIGSVHSSNISYNNNYFNIIPYINFFFTTPKKNSYRISYTQRLQRPNIKLLDPYVNDLNPENISYGNPNLKAVVLHTFAANWSRYSKKWNFNIGMTAAFTDNDISSVTFLNPQGIYETTYNNIGTRQNYRMNGSITFKQIDKIHLSTVFNVAYVDINTKNEGLHKYGVMWNGGLNATVNLWKNALGMAGLKYTSSRFDIQNEYDDTWDYNLGIKQSFCDNKLSITFNTRTPFNMYRTTMTNRSDKNYDVLIRQKVEWREYSISLNYRFGKFGKEVNKAKRTIKNDDLLSPEDLQ